MQSNVIWTVESVTSLQKLVDSEIESFIMTNNLDAAIINCMNKVFSQSENNDIKTITYIVATLKLISLTPKARKEFGSQVQELERLATMLLEKNRIKSGKSKLSFIYGQIKQAKSAISRNDGNTWSALWESSLGLYLSNGSANPQLPFQHINFVVQSINQGYPARSLEIIDELKDSSNSKNINTELSILKSKALKLSGKMEAATNELVDIEDLSKLQDRVKFDYMFLNAVKKGETKELYQSLYGRNAKDWDYHDGYLICAFWLMAQPSKVHAKLCPTMAIIKKKMKSSSRNTRHNNLIKVLSTVLECHDASTPIVRRIEKVGMVMPIIETLEAEYKLLALAALLRFFNQRQKQFAAIFHAEYTALSNKLSEGQNSDVYKLFPSVKNLDTISPFYSTLQNDIEKEQEEYELSEVDSIVLSG